MTHLNTQKILSLSSWSYLKVSFRTKSNTLWHLWKNYNLTRFLLYPMLRNVSLIWWKACYVMSGEIKQGPLETTIPDVTPVQTLPSKLYETTPWLEDSDNLTTASFKPPNLTTCRNSWKSQRSIRTFPSHPTFTIFSTTNATNILKHSQRIMVQRNKLHSFVKLIFHHHFRNSHTHVLLRE